MTGEGARKWFFPDGQLPPLNEEGPLKAHEALMFLNTGDRPAHVSIDVYWEDREPVKGIPILVGAERVYCIHLDVPEQLNGLVIPREVQYALRVTSDVPIIVQFGRLDASQVNLAYYTTMGFFTD